MPILTDEQRAIVDHPLAKGEALKAIAYAGTGKTSTLVEVARKHQCDVLYLAFNKSVEQEAIERFPVNTTCKTGHALAWHHIGCRYANIANLYNWQVGKAYGLSLYESSLLLRSLEAFLNSADAMPLECHIEPDSLHRLDPAKYLSGMVQRVEQCWRDMQAERNNIPMTHSGYLKMFGLAIATGEITLGYPVILLDEAQDTNPVMLKIVLDQMRKGSMCYFVGDPYQQIYSWRGALDAMTKIDAPSYRITQSFRFGSAVAQCASLLLREFFGEQTPLTGLAATESTIGPVGPKHTVICRTNGGLVGEAYKHGKKCAGITVIGEQAFRQTLDDIQDIFLLSERRNREIQARRISMHATYARLKEYAEETLDVELSSKIQVIENFGRSWPDMMETIKVAQSRPTDITLTTCHKAKGLEWPDVRLADDFKELFHAGRDENGDPVALLKKATRDVKDDETEIHPEEVNLLYVATTRAKNTLEPTYPVQQLLHGLYARL
jgi:F-box protein 18 (helicase)